MSVEEEAAILAPFKERAEKGELVEVSEIAKAYQAAVDHPVSNGQIYFVLHRHGWRKVMPRSKHPRKASDEEIAASKKLRQHRTIASARFDGSFPPILRFEKLEILRSRWRRRSLTDAACPLRVHTVFLHFSNLDLTKKSLAESACRIVRCCPCSAGILIIPYYFPFARQEEKYFSFLEFDFSFPFV